jgi:hypothetical protein
MLVVVVVIATFQDLLSSGDSTRTPDRRLGPVEQECVLIVNFSIISISHQVITGSLDGKRVVYQKLNCCSTYRPLFE